MFENLFFRLQQFHQLFHLTILSEKKYISVAVKLKFLSGYTIRYKRLCRQFLKYFEIKLQKKKFLKKLQVTHSFTVNRIISKYKLTRLKK